MSRKEAELEALEAELTELEAQLLESKERKSGFAEASKRKLRASSHKPVGVREYLRRRR